MVHNTCVFNSYRWYSSIWSCFHWVVLHFDFHMAEPVLLHIWLPFYSLSDLDNHVCGDNNSSLLLPVVQWRLLLVVEILSDCWILCIVLLSLFCFLFLQQVGNHKAGFRNLVFRLHVDCLLCLLCANGNNWFLCLLLVCSEDLLLCEDRLIKRFWNLRRGHVDCIICLFGVILACALSKKIYSLVKIEYWPYLIVCSGIVKMVLLLMTSICRKSCKVFCFRLLHRTDKQRLKFPAL